MFPVIPQKKSQGKKVGYSEELAMPRLDMRVSTVIE